MVIVDTSDVPVGTTGFERTPAFAARSCECRLSAYVRYLFCQLGLRFSANAFGPSFASSVAKTRCEICDSIL